MTEAFFTKQFSSLRKKRREEIDKIEKTFGVLDQLVPYYITPDGQNVNAADLEDDDTGLVARDNIFKLLDTFFAGPARFSHAFVLSDAGMGICDALGQCGTRVDAASVKVA